LTDDIDNNWCSCWSGSCCGNFRTFIRNYSFTQTQTLDPIQQGHRRAKYQQLARVFDVARKDHPSARRG
jgi:hypothetical protein